MEPLPNQFTARRLAELTGRKRQAVQKLVSGITPHGTIIISGNIANTYLLDQLPSELKQELEAKSRQSGYRTFTEMLHCPVKLWQPKIPLSEIADACVQDAVDLKAALSAAINLHIGKTGTTAEIEQAGIDGYRRKFNRIITGRYVRKLIQRTAGRVKVKSDWERVEVYLDERPARKNRPAVIDFADRFPSLNAYIDECGYPATETEERGIWTLTFDEYHKRIEEGEKSKKIARQLRACLFAKAPFIAASREALFKAFARKLQEWEKQWGDPKSLRDGREENGDHFHFPDEDNDRLIHKAVFYRKHLAAAWRELYEGKKLSAAVLERYTGKSVPAKVWELQSEIEIFRTIYQGSRAFDQIKGHVDRSYDGIPSRKCMSADDFTMPIYFYIPDGNGWFSLTRGQILLFIDFRTLKILGWSMQPDRNYSSLVIRSLCTHVFGAYGVPDVLQFERGIWKSSQIITGSKNPERKFTEVAQGLREFGIKFIHSIRARSKTVERVGGLMQDLMGAEPGYCGRDERRDMPESLLKQKAAVTARKPGCLDYFYSFDDWYRRFGELVLRYNENVQHGKMLDGLSPDQAFEKFSDPHDAPMEFSAGLRYLLAHDKRPARVTGNGITIRIGKKEFNYKGTEIAHLWGKDVLAWFDPENTDTLVVTDMEKNNPVCVGRSKQPSALECIVSPDSGVLAGELERVEDQASYVKARYKTVKCKFELPQRKLLNDARSARAIELGTEIATARAGVAEKQKVKEKSNRLARRLNMALPESAAIRPETATALTELQKFLNDED